MPIGIVRRLLTSVALLLVFSRFANCDEPKAEAETAKKYRALVQQLASPNQKPTVKNEMKTTINYPEDYDSNTQKRVEAARQALYENFEDALPYLVEALNDGRYSMTIQWIQGNVYNYSVGKICRHIIECHLQVYRRAIQIKGLGHWHDYTYEVISVDWYLPRKDRTFAELQIEAIDWALEKQKKEKADIEKLVKLRDEIATSGKPAKPSPMYPMKNR